jgi:hypothetical protein
VSDEAVLECTVDIVPGVLDGVAGVESSIVGGLASEKRVQVEIRRLLPNKNKNSRVSFPKWGSASQIIEPEN